MVQTPERPRRPRGEWLIDVISELIEAQERTNALLERLVDATERRVPLPASVEPADYSRLLEGIFRAVHDHDIGFDSEEIVNLRANSLELDRALAAARISTVAELGYRLRQLERANAHPTLLLERDPRRRLWFVKARTSTHARQMRSSAK